jgi:hypothetical protein
VDLKPYTGFHRLVSGWYTKKRRDTTMNTLLLSAWIILSLLAAIRDWSKRSYEYWDVRLAIAWFVFCFAPILLVYSIVAGFVEWISGQCGEYCDD